MGRIGHRELARLGAGLLVVLLSVAARGEPSFTPVPGFAGFFRAGEWTPISVLIENRPDSQNARPYTLEGTLRAVVEPVQGDVTIFSRQVSVTHQQRLRVTLYARIPEGGGCVVEFLTRRGRRLWSQDLTRDFTELKAGESLVVVASEQGALFTPRSALSLPGLKRAHMPPVFFPDRWIGYESVDLIVFMQDPGNALADENQREALLRWVRLGGRLLAIGGVHYQSYQASFLEPILPAAIKGSEEAAFPRSDGDPIRMLAASLELKSGATGLWNHDGRWLAARWPVGLGEATHAAIDIDSSVARDIPEARAFWDSAAYAPGLRRRHSTSESLVLAGANFAFGRAAQLPSVLLILSILACYAVLVGPVNFYILKKRRRLELAWITIPAIVAAFSVLTYGIGFLAKGGLLIVREMDVLQTAAGASEAQLEKLVSLFCPRKRSFNVAVNAPQSAVCSVWEWRRRGVFLPQSLGPGGGRRALGGVLESPVAGAGWPLVIDQTRRPMTIQDRLVAQWSTQNFAALGAVDLDGSFQGEATLQGRELAIRLKNASGLRVSDAVLLVCNVAGRVGDLKPGEEREFSVPLDEGRLARGFGAQGMGSVAAALSSWGRYVSVDDLGTNQEENAANVAAFLRAKVWQRFTMPADGFAAPVGQPLRPRLMGWLEDPPQTLEIDAAPDRAAHVAMLTVDFPARLGPGLFSVSAAECASQLVNVELSEMGQFNAQPDGGCDLAGGEAVFACSPGVRSGAFSISSVKPLVEWSNANEHTVTVSAFDFSTEQWEDLTEDTAGERNPEFRTLRGESANPIDGAVFLRVAVRPKNPNRYAEKPVRLVRAQAAFVGRAL